MKTLTTLTLTVLLALATANAYAERLVLDPAGDMPAFRYTLQDRTGSTYNWMDGIEVADKETDTVFRLFCTDLYTYTSSAMSNGTGQNYNTVDLSASPFHTAVQMDRLQSLFDHVYTKAFNDDYSVNNGFYAALFQFAVWEIANETADHLSLRDGEIYLTNASVLQGTYYTGVYGSKPLNDALDTLDAWFYAILNDAWDEVGYSEEKVNLTVYLADGGTNVSQTFIGVDPYRSATPEPATMLVMGLGIAGVAVARRIRRK